MKKIDQVIAEGPYRDDWASLSRYPEPEWYRKAKFGIFIHWGVYSVPVFGSEWYPRNMYLEGTKEFEHHVRTYGLQNKFDYKDFIPMFKAAKFDAREWVKLFLTAVPDISCLLRNTMTVFRCMTATFRNGVPRRWDRNGILSKNGCMLLNIGPKADGTITEAEQEVLKCIGSWLKVNGESIYDTTYWQVFGEGPTRVDDGEFTDINRQAFTSEDIRFTYKAPYVYANVLVWLKNGKVTVKSLGSKKFNGIVQCVSVLGYGNPVSFRHMEDSLEIQVEGKIDSRYPVGLKIAIE